MVRFTDSSTKSYLTVNGERKITILAEDGRLVYQRRIPTKNPFLLDDVIITLSADGGDPKLDMMLARWEILQTECDEREARDGERTEGILRRLA